MVHFFRRNKRSDPKNKVHYTFFKRNKRNDVEIISSYRLSFRGACEWWRTSAVTLNASILTSSHSPLSPHEPNQSTLAALWRLELPVPPVEISMPSTPVPVWSVSTCTAGDRAGCFDSQVSVIQQEMLDISIGLPRRGCLSYTVKDPQ